MRVHLILIDGDRFPLAHQRSIVLVLGWPVQIKREIATLKLLKHPNVVRLYEVKLHLSHPPLPPTPNPPSEFMPVS